MPVGSLYGFNPVDLWTTEVVQANTFTACTALNHTTTGWQRAQANIAANIDIWLCISATPTRFKIANTCRIYNCPSHGLGADDSVLYLSTLTAGLLTTTPPTTGQLRMIMGVIFDANNILWRPNITVEIV